MNLGRLLAAGVCVLFSIGSYEALAGTRDGGGGVGVRCAGASLQLLDLHEALRAGLEPSTRPLTREKAINVTSNLLTDQLWYVGLFDRDQFLGAVKSIVTSMLDGQPFYDFSTGNNDTLQFVSELPLSQDLGVTNVAAGCTLEQVAYFFDDSATLQIVKSRWDELDWLNRSALITHELIYLFNRRQALENFGLNRQGLTSQGARDFVGKLFSINGVHPKYDLFPTGVNYLSCGSSEEPRSDFLMIDSGDQEVTLLINGLYGMGSIFETNTKIHGTTVNKFWRSWEGKDLDSLSAIQLVDEARAPSFLLHLSRKVGQLAKLEAFQERGADRIPLGAPQTITCEMRTSR